MPQPGAGTTRGDGDEQRGQRTPGEAAHRTHARSGTLPFDLGTLQEICSKKLGLGAQETLDIAQSLYETHKVITYPRSDCGYLPVSQHGDAATILAALGRADPAVSALMPHLDAQRRSRAWNDAKVSAHHGIIPTGAGKDLAQLTGKHRAVYTLVRA